MSIGSDFEKEFEKSVTCFIQKLEVKDKRKMCDFLVFDGVMLYGCECKSYGERLVIPISKKSHIKHHQIDGLADMVKHKNCLGLFILNFRKADKTYIVPANYIRVLRDKGKKSISISQAKENHVNVRFLKNTYNNS